MALREMGRSKARFGLLGGAVALLVLLLLFFQATASTLVAALTGGIDRVAADVVVYDARARSNPAVSVLPLGALEEVAAVDGVAAVGPVALTFGEAELGGEVTEIALVGIEPGQPGTPRDVEGRLPGPGQAIASGSGFEPGYAVGDRVRVGSLEVDVVATAQGAAYSALPTIYVPLGDYSEILRTRVGGDAEIPHSFLAVSSRDPGVAAAINDAVAGVQALDRASAVAALPGIETIGRSFGILYLLLFIVVTVVSGVFFLILTVQKRDALVLLRAVGAERRDVITLVLVQVVVVVGVGVGVGSGLAAALLAAARDTFGAALDLGTTVRSAAAVLALGLLAASGAVRRVLTIAPVDAIRPGGLT
jgi:putative ABC transport system permease protein